MELFACLDRWVGFRLGWMCLDGFWFRVGTLGLCMCILALVVGCGFRFVCGGVGLVMLVDLI